MINYFQALPRSQLSQAELALLSIDQAIRPASTNSTEIAGNEQNLLSNTCRPALVELKKHPRSISELLDKYRVTVGGGKLTLWNGMLKTELYIQII